MVRVRYSFGSRHTGRIENIKKQRQKYPKIMKDVIAISDIVLEVLDARYIEETRNVEIEEQILNSALVTRNNVPSKKGTSKEVPSSSGKLAFALQENVFAMLVEVAERALAHTGKSELLLGGGVACNTRLVEMCRIMCEERGCKLFVPEKSLLVDNGAMIGYLGLKIWKTGLGTLDYGSVDIAPRERTDEVEVLWE